MRKSAKKVRQWD